MTTKSLYEVLGAAPSAPKDEIQKAYRRAAMRTHPDRDGGSEADFKEVEAAGKVLLDDEARKRYDETGFAPGGEPPLEQRVRAMVFDVFTKGMVMADKAFHDCWWETADALRTERDNLSSKRETLERNLASLEADEGKLKLRAIRVPNAGVDFARELREEMARRLATTLVAMAKDLEFLSLAVELFSAFDAPPRQQEPEINALDDLARLFQSKGFSL